VPGNFYERRILPRLLDLAMRHREATRFRTRLVPVARGTVLELGSGSGLNLPFYGAKVERLIALDTSAELAGIAQPRARRAPFPVEFLQRPAEDIPLADASVDTVVVTFTLCSVSDPAKALLEARRVLKPGGELLFAEHGLAPDPEVRRWQKRLNPVWKRIAGGCHLDRPMDELIRRAGFQFSALQASYAKGPRPMTYVYAGRARQEAAPSGDE
jgi:ubiquinone/menaquinone biosynthesis C-methylase UbiE